MAYEIKEASCPEDLPEITRLLYASFESPPQKHFLIYHPIFDTGPTAREEAIKASTRRQIERNAKDPTEKWMKVVDEKSGKIIAAALWNFYTENPYKDWKPMDVFWWPEGPQRDYVNEYFRIHDEPLVKLSARPHLMLKILFTHPEYRRNGAATELMRWGMLAADERAWETWLTSWGLATPFYEHLGFETKQTTRVQPTMENPPQEWLEFDAKVQPATAYTQMRPKQTIK